MILVYIIVIVNRYCAQHFSKDDTFKGVSFMLKILFVLFCASILSGCQSINNRGEYVEDAKLSAIEKNQVSKGQVIEMLGEPTIVPDYTPNVWYYVSRKVQDKVWSRPSIKSQRIVKIIFNGDHVEKVDINDKRPQNNINVERDATTAKGTEATAIQTFVKNFGRFNKSSRKKRR